MLKTILLLLIFVGTTFSAQNYTEQQVDKTTDPKVVASFIKSNPNHPKTPEYKRKLYELINGGSSATAKTKTENTNKKEATTTAKKGNTVAAGNQKTAGLLTHLFNNDPNKKEAYIHIRNKSKCSILVKIKGKSKVYSLSVPAEKDNYILVNKGSYAISTSICKAKYYEVKNVQKDMEITLNMN